ncbi:MAG TPA: 50S ribosomal protein L35 [Peptococcaceae bacterium]|nr:50S ribosomal protein L35 [Peptococcaceae bacterium]
MPKMKTHRGAAKRFKKTGTGKIVRYHAYKSHILEKKSPKRKRNLRKSAVMHKSDAKRIERLIAYVK